MITQEAVKNTRKLATETMQSLLRIDRSGKLLYIFCKQMCACSKQYAYDNDYIEHNFVVITEDEYNELLSR